MCGIAACFAYADGAPPADRRALSEISEALARRGPDGAGEWASADGRVALAHRRLAIIDLSEAAAQPMVLGEAEGGPLAISFNGEIYNYQELRRGLAARGARFRTTSDTEVLLHLYREHGPDMVHHLRGMFAFALWDAPRQQLVLARDPFGIKPLYLADDGRTAWAASQVKALRRARVVSGKIEPAGHVGFFVWGHVPEPLTLFRDIRSVPAGSTLVIRRGAGRREKRYFEPARTLAAAEVMAAKPRDKIGILNESLRQSVASHLVSDTPVGIFLSSGVDSTTIAALAAELSPTPLTSVTLAFEEFRDTRSDEAPLATRTAQALGLRHHTRVLARSEFFADLDALLAAMDQPTVDGVNTYFVSKAARECGLKVALSGTGGDEMFAGYPSFAQIPTLVSWLSRLNGLPEPVRQAIGRGFRRVAAPLMRNRVSPKYASLFEFGSTYGGAYLLRRGLFMPWELPAIIDADMARAGWRDLDELASLNRLHQGIKDGRTKVMACELSVYLRDQLLRQTDWAGMAHSVEVRVPLVDVELFRTLAPLLVVEDPLTKTDFARASRDRLPPWTLNRPKTGFDVPLSLWLAANGHGGGSAGLRSWAKRVYAHATAPGR